MKRFPILFVLFLLAILASLAVACSPQALSTDGGASGVAPVLNADATGVAGYYARGVIDIETDGTPSMAGLSLAEVEAFFSGFTGPMGLDTFVVPPAVMAALEDSGAQVIQLSLREGEDGRAIIIKIDGTKLGEVQVNSAQQVVGLVERAGYLPASAMPIIEAAFQLLASAEYAEADLGLRLPAYYTAAAHQVHIIWPALNTPGQSAAEQAAAIAADTYTDEVGSGEGPWSMANRAAAAGRDFQCVMDALEDHRASGGSWRAGDDFSFGPGECEARTNTPARPASGN